MTNYPLTALGRQIDDLTQMAASQFQDGFYISAARRLQEAANLCLDLGIARNAAVERALRPEERLIDTLRARMPDTGSTPPTITRKGSDT